jgi:hypothetical protein
VTAGDAIATDGETDKQYPDYSDSPYCSDKGPLLDIIRSTGVDIDHHEQRDIICSYLPNWSEVVALYGDEPRIIGLERCQEYRDMLAQANQTSQTPIYPMARVAGLQNCGTTAYADTLFNNMSPNPTLHNCTNERVYNVPWRKHTPWHFRYNITSPYHGWVENKDHVLPIVVVRDPYRWMAVSGWLASAVVMSGFSKLWNSFLFVSMPLYSFSFFQTEHGKSESAA